MKVVVLTVGLLLFGCTVLASGGTTLTADQVARGQAIRELLVNCITSESERGTWPVDMPVLAKSSTPDLIYLGLPSILKGALAEKPNLRPMEPVCHEPLDVHPDGVWIGYGDGHLEFVRDDAALQTALAQPQQIRTLLDQHLPSYNALQLTPKPDTKRIVHVVDESGRPIEGAAVGRLWTDELKESGGAPKIVNVKCDDEGNDFESQGRTDSSGCVEVQFDWFFSPNQQMYGPSSLVVYDQQRGLIAQQQIEASAFTEPNGANTPPIDVPLRSGVPVTGSFTRVGAPMPEKPFWTGTSVRAEAFRGGGTPMQCTSNQQTFEFLLPPGDFVLEPFGSGAYGTRRLLHIEEGAKPIHLEIDLPPDRLTMLQGQPAPELQKIKAWKNGDPTTLEKLRGKWVLLDFWGYWCGPCVHEIPELMRLHDEYAEKGLVVIAIHDDSVASIEEMDQKLEKTKAKLWNGRDLPFLVAIDGGGRSPIPLSSRSSKGATTAIYGIQAWPTTVLIGPEGTVVVSQVGDLARVRERLIKELGSAKTRE